MDTTQTRKPFMNRGALVLKSHTGCGGFFKGTELDIGTGTIKLICTTCGVEDTEHLSDREKFQEQWDSGFFQKRKNCAWHTLRRANITAPGQALIEEFRGVRYRLEVGPRGGTRIHEV